MGTSYAQLGIVSTRIPNMGRKLPARDDPAFGAWLAREIKRAGMNQKEFADAAGVGTSTVSRWINGRVPDAQYCDLIADALQLDIDDVLARAGYRPREVSNRDELKRRLIVLIERADLGEGRGAGL